LNYHHRPERSMKYHEKIFETIKNQQPGDAAEAMKKHLEGTKIMLR
jgi:DNA-binding FadR family transcriptional regulator